MRAQEDLEHRIKERTEELELAIDFLRREMDERRIAEKEQRKLESQMQHAQRMESVGVLAGGVAHEFNNLLTSIMGYASMAALELPASVARQGEYRARACGGQERGRPHAADAGLFGTRPLRTRVRWISRRPWRTRRDCWIR